MDPYNERRDVDNERAAGEQSSMPPNFKRPKPSVIFYKIDHFGDPLEQAGRIVLGVEACMKGLRATAKKGQTIVAIGGRSAGRRSDFKASRVLRDRLVWVGVVTEVRPGAAPDLRPLVECVGVFFGGSGPLDWRIRWPVLGPWVDNVGQMHRVRAIPPDVRVALREVAACALKSRRKRQGAPEKAKRGKCPMPSPRTFGGCRPKPESPC